MPTAAGKYIFITEVTYHCNGPESKMTSSNVFFHFFSDQQSKTQTCSIYSGINPHNETTDGLALLLTNYWNDQPINQLINQSSKSEFSSVSLWIDTLVSSCKLSLILRVCKSNVLFVSVLCNEKQKNILSIHKVQWKN